jgi:hypothetical protein
VDGRGHGGFGESGFLGGEEGGGGVLLFGHASRSRGWVYGRGGDQSAARGLSEAPNEASRKRSLMWPLSWYPKIRAEGLRRLGIHEIQSNLQKPSSRFELAIRTERNQSPLPHDEKRTRNDCTPVEPTG